MQPLYVINNYGQFNHLIARTLRDLGIEAEMVSNQTPPEDVAR
jgi:GMP synthase (glutamine-hydrolysing)